MRRIARLLAPVLILVLLTGCAGLTSAMNGTQMVHYEDMVYTIVAITDIQRPVDLVFQ